MKRREVPFKLEYTITLEGVSTIADGDKKTWQEKLFTKMLDAYFLSLKYFLGNNYKRTKLIVRKPDGKKA